MIEKKRRCAAFAVCGSFCTLEAALDAARALRGQGWELLPVMSFAAGQDTRFGRASGWRHQLEGLTGRPVLDTLQGWSLSAHGIWPTPLLSRPARGPRWPGWPRAFPTRR